MTKEVVINSMSTAVKVVIDNYPDDHEYHGNELKDDVVKIYPDAIDMYVDTILKMMRRHRRDSYICIDRNNSLYKKIAKKSIINQIKEAAPKEPPEERTQNVPAQGYLFAFFVFFVLGFGAVFPLDLGCPLLSHCFKNSISSDDSFHMAFTPIYRAGLYPCRISLLCAAPGVVLMVSPTSVVVNSKTSIYMSISAYKPTDQGENAENGEMSAIWTIILHRRKAFPQKFTKILKDFCPNLDHRLRRV